MPDDLARTDSPLAEPVRRDSSPPERDRCAVQPVPTGHGTLHPSAGTEDDPGTATDLGRVIETVVSPFHCLYQDALYFHTQSRLAQSEGEAARLARAALLLYVSSAEALVRQAAVELGRPELRGLLADPSRPLPLAEAWRLLPAIVAEPGVPTRTFVPESAPWPQFAELLMLETSWVYPGPPSVAPCLLSLNPPRQRLRAARAASRPPALRAHSPNRDPDFSAHRLAARPLLSSASPPRHRARHSRCRHRSPRPPHGRRSLPVPAPSPRAGPRDLSDAKWKRGMSGLRAGGPQCLGLCDDTLTDGAKDDARL